MKQYSRRHPIIKVDSDRIYWRKVDPVVLVRYIKKNPDYKLKDLAELFDCTIPSIHHALKILNIKKIKEKSSKNKYRNSVEFLIKLRNLFK
jgi:transposase